MRIEVTSDGGWVEGDLLCQQIDMRIPFKPAAELSPNARVHWSKKHRATREWKVMGWAYGKKIMNAATGIKFPLPPAKLHYDFNFRTRHRRDDDNLAASMKPFRDGLVSAGVFKDDSSEHLKEGEHNVIFTGVDEIFVMILW